MRVKPKWDGGPGYPVVREYAEHFVVNDPECQHQLLALPKSDYEPVPQETWRDVTDIFRENHWKRTDYYISDGPTIALNGKYDGYRLRKVGMVELHNLWQGKDEPCAFIIEKKERTNGE